MSTGLSSTNMTDRDEIKFIPVGNGRSNGADTEDDDQLLMGNLMFNEPCGNPVHQDPDSWESRGVGGGLKQFANYVIVNTARMNRRNLCRVLGPHTRVTDRRLTELENGVEKVRRESDEVDSEIEEMKGGMEKLQGNLGEVKGRMGKLQVEMQNLKNCVLGLAEKVNGLVEQRNVVVTDPQPLPRSTASNNNGAEAGDSNNFETGRQDDQGELNVEPNTTDQQEDPNDLPPPGIESFSLLDNIDRLLEGPRKACKHCGKLLMPSYVKKHENFHCRLGPRMPRKRTVRTTPN